MENNEDNMVMAIFRHLIQFAGGAVTSYGVMSADDVQVVSGAIISVATVAWAVCKRKNVKICQ